MEMLWLKGSAPAVDHDGPGVWRIEELDLANEAQQAGGVAGNAVVRPAGEMKLPDFADLVMALLNERASGQFKISDKWDFARMDSI